MAEEAVSQEQEDKESSILGTGFGATRRRRATGTGIYSTGIFIPVYTTVLVEHHSCRAENRKVLGPALQQADALPTEPRRTLVNLIA